MSFKSKAINAVLSCKSAQKVISEWQTNQTAASTAPRPKAFSLWSHIDHKDPDPTLSYIEPDPIGEYTTWPMLTNKRYSTRHLPPTDQSYVDGLPEDLPYIPGQQLGDITSLFKRDGVMDNSRSSSLFMFFAQWFTDSVLRTDSVDRRKNTSNHNIDLCQIYGRSEESARALRSMNGGKLRCRIGDDGEEYLDYLGEVVDGKWQVKEHYKCLPYANEEVLSVIFAGWDDERIAHAYATGLERGNSSVGYTAISTLFMREHNRICDELAAAHPEWNISDIEFDERLFQTARMINTVILLKLVIEEYINHIAGFNIFVMDNSYAERQNWYREPWVSIEFDMLYRWHGLIPDQMSVNGTAYDQREYRFNNMVLEAAGLGAIITGASTSVAGRIGLKNVPAFMMGAEYANVRMGRDFRLQPYNEYRKKFGLKPLRSFSELTKDAALAAELERLYGFIDNVEFCVGLFAEDASGGALFGDLMNKMVAYDAFTQIYTNPLLSKNVYNERTFTRCGLDIIKGTSSMQDMVNRNLKDSDSVTACFAI